jgi:hypothetical protein
MTPLSINGRSALIIVASFFVSFVLAAGATAMLRGSGDDTPDPAATTSREQPPAGRSVSVGGSVESLWKDVEPWRVTFAAASSGAGRYAAPARRASPDAHGLGGSAISDPVVAELRERKPGGTANRAVMQFLESRERRKRSNDLSRVAWTVRDSASFLAAAAAGCLPQQSLSVESAGDLLGDAQQVGFGETATPRPHATRITIRGATIIVRQVAVIGRGRRKMAVSIVARADSPEAAAGMKPVMKKVAGWIEDHVRLAKGVVNQSC